MLGNNPARPVSYVRMDVDMLFDLSISDNVKVTYAQLKAMAFEAGNKSQVSVDPGSFESLTGKAKSTLHGHLSALRGLGVLQYTTSKDGIWMVVFGVSTGDPTSDSRNLEPTYNNNIDNFKIDSDSLNSLRDSESIFQKVTGFFTIPAGAREAVGAAIFPMLDKFGDRDKVVKYLKPFWEAWLERKYNRQNCNWLTEWAVVGEIPALKNKPYVQRGERNAQPTTENKDYRSDKFGGFIDN